MSSRAIAQVSSGLILGFSSVIYAVTYAALMFSGPLAPYLGYAVTLCLVTAVFGALYGRFSEEPTLVSGPESNTSSILAGILGGALASGSGHAGGTLNHAVAIVLAGSLFTGICYVLIQRFHLTRLVRFIPLQVTAGFLASTGWLMASGALNIIAGTPLTLQGLLAVLQQPWRPELYLGIVLAGVLALLQRRVPPAIAIPMFVVTVSLVANAVLRGACGGGCDLGRWFFPSFSNLEWLPPWQLHVDGALLLTLLELLPSFIALAFVATLTVLLSFSSLELAYGRDFAPDDALRQHGRWAFLATLFGGYAGAISIGRSTISRNTGGGPWSGIVNAGVCAAVLFGLGWILAWVPRAALGALLLYMGVGMLKQWVWDLRKTMHRPEWLLVVGILVCVVAFGYVVGFLAGLLAACIFFVVNYSQMPFIALDTTIAAARSTVLRNSSEQAWLARAGERCRVGRFEGFVFFGVASAIYDWYRAADPERQPMCLLDFTRARGIDPSAVAVLEKIARNQAGRRQPLLLVLGPNLRERIPLRPAPFLEMFDHLDAALERAEDLLLAQAEGDAATRDTLLGPTATDAEVQTLREYLEPVQLGAGDYLFREGQRSDDMYFVESGSLEVVKTAIDGHTLRLAKVHAGAILGEMAMYTGQPRSASALAVEPSLLQRLTSEARMRMQHDHPRVAALLDRQVVLGLAGNLSRTNSLLRLQVG